jgi:ParB-like chromosome segregation protein Spo0J
MKIELKRLKLSQIENNSGQIDGVPKNPRFIRDERYASLLKSLKDFPEMLQIRELVVVQVDKKYIAVAGNMRLRALNEIGAKTTICKVLIDFPVEKIREFAIKDNEGYGQTDWDVMANEWDEIELQEWGVELPTEWGEDIPDFENNSETENKAKELCKCPKCGFEWEK